MRKLFLILVAFCLNVLVFGQANKFGIPFIKNYSSTEYEGSEQNWAIIQDNRGVMYFGNNDDGILEYDGHSWRKITTPNKSIVRSFTIDEKGIIYVGAQYEFGYLTPDKFGKLNFKSLLPLIDTSKVKIKDILQTFYYDNSIYYCSQYHIIQFTPPNTIKTIPLSKFSFFSFLIGNKIYTSNYPHGLKELDIDSLKLSNGGNFFAKTDIYSILQYNNDNLILFVVPDENPMDPGIYFYNSKTGNIEGYKKNGFSEFTNKLLVDGRVYHAIKQINNNFVFATLDKGCIVTDLKGNLVSIFNPQNGIRNERVFYSYDKSIKDNIQPLWLALNKGISKVETSSSICRFGEESGLKGIVMDVVRYKGTLYVGTNTGVFYLGFDENQSPKFMQVKNTVATWAFLKFKTASGQEKLLAASHPNIWEINQNVAQPIDNKFFYCYNIAQSKINPSVLHVGSLNFYKTLKYANGKWNKNNEFEGVVKDEIRNIAEDIKGNTWLATYISGLVKISPSLQISIYNNANGLPTNLKNIKAFNYNDKIIFCTSQGFYKYNETSDSFMPDTSFGLKYADGSLGIFTIASDKKGTLWLCLNKEKENIYWIEHLIPHGENSYTIDSLPFKRFPNKLSINNIYPDPDNEGVVWLATSDGVYSYNDNFKRNYKQKYNTLIRNVTIGEDSVIFYGTYYKTIDSARKEVSLIQPEELKPILKYKNNKISFIYAAPFFEDELSIEYSHYLEGFDEGWSKWSKENKAPYTNLPEGKYKFRVKAKNIYGIEGNEAIYEFEILPPWYRTVWAYISYAILAILIVWGIVKLATRRMKQLNIAYGRYLPGAFLKLLEKRRVIDFKLGDMTEKEMTIMFSDIRSYTNLSETMTPFDNFRFQVRYLSMIGIELNKNHGFPVQYYGDGIVAMFPGDPDTAVAASIDMHKRVEQYSMDRKAKKRREIRIGVGMHTGKIIMGIRGDKWRWEGGIVGDSVNLASRMEGLTKIFGTSTLISDDTYNKLKNKEKFNIRFLGRVKVKGKDLPVGLYEIIDGLPQEDFQLKLSTKNDFDNALAIYYKKDFKKALGLFTEIIKINSNDFTAHHYIDLCRLYIKEEVPEDWDGVEKLDKK